MNKLLPILFLLAGCSLETGGADGSAPTISMEASVFGSGALSIAGTVELPPATSASRAIRLEILGVSGTSGNQLQGGVVTTVAKEVKYQITGLPSGNYKIRMMVDETNDGSLGDSGDLDGWYDGTITSPIQASATAVTIIIASISQTAKDFGISELP